MSTRDDVRLLTAGEVAAALQANPNTVTRWAASGRLVSVLTAGGHHRFFAVEVGALLAGESRERARELGLAEKARLLGRAGG